MVKLKATIIISEFLAGLVGLLMFFYRNYLFGIYAKNGATSPDTTHVVLVNNHGSYSYITLVQSNYLHSLVVISFAFVVLVAILHVIQTRISK